MTCGTAERSPRKVAQQLAHLLLESREAARVAVFSAIVTRSVSEGRWSVHPTPSLAYASRLRFVREFLDVSSLLTRKAQHQSLRVGLVWIPFCAVF